MSTSPDLQLVTIVITTYNHDRYLPDAVQSALQQDYIPIELIVVDDGSTDDTPRLMTGYPSVRYIRQANQGLAAARNVGLAHAKGEWICFLDADDALLPNAISTQIGCAANQNTVGFISGGHIIADENLNPQKEVAAEVPSHHYNELLQRNYIGMHAAVLYRKSVLQENPFDTSFTGCEDYDVYLRISAQHPVITHTQPIAVYRTLRSSMSGNLPMMLDQACRALNKQKPLLQTTEHKKAYQKGLQNWNDLYCYAMVKEIDKEQIEEEKRSTYLRTLLKCKPKLYIRHYINKIIRISKTS